MLSLFPLLKTERELYDMPRGMERFRRYLDVMTAGTGDMVLPLPALNPMAKPHVAAVLEALIANGAEEVAAAAVADAEWRLGPVKPDLRVALVIADDVAGGWTNRELIEAENLRVRPNAMLRRGWLPVTLWASEPTTREKVREETLSGVFRTLFLMRHEPPAKLREMLALIGFALEFAEAAGPTLDAEELAYSREVISPHLDSTELPTVLPCLFGDEAARRVGHKPMGLSRRAGYAVALADAKKSGVTPESFLADPDDVNASFESPVVSST